MLTQSERKTSQTEIKKYALTDHVHAHACNIHSIKKESTGASSISTPCKNAQRGYSCLLNINSLD